MKSLGELRKEKGVLVAAHRGTSGGNIPPNTIAAFDLALKEGADILEMDLFKSLDGEIFVFHTGTDLLIWIGISGLKAGRRKKSEICGFATVTWKKPS